MSEAASETPVQVVHRHVEAQGRRDIAAFMADCAAGIRVLNANGETVLEGLDAFRTMYAGIFSRNLELKTDLIDRISVGPWVIDEQLLTGFADGSQMHIARVYHVEDGKIMSIQVFH